jgi:hypothetical protein
MEYNMSVRVIFDSVQDFNTWHNAIMEKYEIPNEFTEKYTELQEIDGLLVAVVKDEDLEGLTITELKPSLPDLLN